MSSLRLELKSLGKRGGFGRQVAVLAGGTAVGQAITVLASPVLTRLYGPEGFGVLAVYTAMVGMAGALAALSYHQAIPLPESDDEAAQVLGVSVLSTLLVAVVLGVSVAVGGSRLATLLGTPQLTPYLWMVPLGALGLSLYEVFTQWAVRKKFFGVVARTSVARGVAQTGTQLSLGWMGLGPPGLLLGQLAGQWTGSGSLLRSAWKESGPAIRSINRAGLRQAASRYKRFPQYTAPAVLLNVMGIDAPPLLLSYFFGGTVTGYYALGARVITMPVALVAKSASSVFFASASQYHREGRLGTEVQSLFRRMVRLVMPPVLIFAVSAPALFALIFGESWREAGFYARSLSPWLLFVFIGFALTPLVSVLEQQRAGMIFQGILSIARIGAIVAGGLFFGAQTTVILFGASSALCWAIYVVWLLSVGKASATRAMQDFLTNGVVAFLFAIPVIAMILRSESTHWIAVVALISAAAAMIRGLSGKHTQ